MTMTSSICPCSASSIGQAAPQNQKAPKTYDLCCGPILAGKKKAATAEELLRARYVAFTQGNVDFVMNTHHSRTVHEIKREEIEEWSKNSVWQGLQIVQIEAGQPEDDKATIAFCARYSARSPDQGKDQGKDQDKPAEKVEEHWEQSFFEKENGQWKFLDAKGIHVGTFRRTEPKVGRNDACPCGSGKKFKKCCAAAA